MRVYTSILSPKWHLTTNGRPKNRKFTEVYPHLLFDLLKFAPPEIDNPSIPYVEMLTLIRNSLHNGGVHYGFMVSPDFTDRKIEYRETEYIFVPGKNLDFVTWDLLLDICDDCRGLFFQMSNHEKIRNISEVIVDPTSSFMQERSTTQNPIKTFTVKRIRPNKNKTDE